ncbi:MAG: FHA domain-containing protein [Pyrinomonadaceae bacterium]|nr:FHA domain-containing protein [Pyrinomonadaceae bacterium]
MKITLAEVRNGVKLPETSFDLDLIRVGRNAEQCQIVYDNAAFPMVSRVHAELRWQGANWVVFDANSSFGTYVNGQKISSPHPVSAGSKIQFGTNGPIVEILSVGDKPAAPPKDVSDSGWATPPPAAAKPQTPPQVHQPAPRTLEKPVLEFLDSGAQPIEITKSSIWLGRDPGGDIVFESTKIMVSRKHAEIRNENGKFVLHDNKSFNGTLVNEQRISVPTPLYHDDRIRLGLGGPVLRFKSPSRTAPAGAALAGQRSIAINQLAEISPANESVGSKTMVFKVEDLTSRTPSAASAEPQLLMSLTFGGKKELLIGRGEDCDIHLDGLQISNRHAKLSMTGSGIVVEDLNSTNGVYLNGNRISRQSIGIDDSVQIGSFVIRVDQANNIGVFDTRAKTRIDSVNITKEVKNRAGGGMIKLLDNVSLSIQPNEFVGLLGPSGAGKSTLMDAMNGMRPATGGSVLINNLDLYRHLDSLKQSIGYVPQDDIIHRELTVYRTLYYVAKLRLSRDVSTSEIDQIIDEVLDVTGLSERREVPINQLSGGQRKRVSIAVELITKPSVIFLDEPTSGLDPATEEKIMILFRQIAESGRTVILTTHAMENVKLFDKLVVLMRGKLVFYGTPDEALAHVGASSFKELYDKLEAPIEERLERSGGSRFQVTEQVAEEWKDKFTKTAQYRNNVYEPLKELGTLQSGGVQKKNRLGLFGAIRQWATLSRRYSQVLLRDKLTLFILLVQAPIIAFLVFLVMGDDQPRDFAYFMLSLVAVWFGTSVAAREIIRERAVFKRERMVNLGLIPYLFSKLFVLGVIVGIQCLLLFLPLKFFDIVGLMPMPGVLAGIPQLWVMLLTAGVGIALGLLISALVKTSEMATSLVPLILIPQILFSGLMGVPQGINKAAGLIMPATWSFDTMKRYSTLDTLEPEGAIKGGETDGLGLYKFIEKENDKIIADAKSELDDYKKDSEKKLENYQKELMSGGSPAAPKLDDPPAIADAKKLPENLSGYINFLHPWMHEILNQLVLMLMFGMLVIATLIVLRLQDTR